MSGYNEKESVSIDTPSIIKVFLIMLFSSAFQSLQDGEDKCS